MNEWELDKEIFGEFNTVQINNETYQLQQVEFEDETFFFVRSFDKVICMIMQNEKNEWQPDCNISRELFCQLMKCINKLYLE